MLVTMYVMFAIFSFICLHRPQISTKVVNTFDTKRKLLFYNNNDRVDLDDAAPIH